MRKHQRRLTDSRYTNMRGQVITVGTAGELQKRIDSEAVKALYFRDHWDIAAIAKALKVQEADVREIVRKTKLAYG